MKKNLVVLLLGVLCFACSQKMNDDYSVAVEIMKNGQYDNAIEIFNRVVSQQSDDEVKSNAMYNIGFCYGLKNDYDKEIEYYKKAIEAYPSCQPALYDLGMIYYKNSDLDNSLKLFEQLKDVNPEHEGAYYMIGVIHRDLGNKEDMIINLQKAVELGSTDAENLINKIEHEMQG